MASNTLLLRRTGLALAGCILALACAACCGGDQQCKGTLEWKGETYQVAGKGPYGAIESGCNQYCAKHDASNAGCARKCASDAVATLPNPLHVACK